MSIPALQALRKRFPDAHIAILAKPWVAALYGREPFCDQLIPYDAPKGAAGLAAKWKMALALRQQHFDCAILFQNAFEAAAVVRLANIPARIGYNRDARGSLLTTAVPVPKPGETNRHQRFYYLELLKRANLIENYPKDGVIRLSGAAAAAESGRTRFRNASILGPVVGVSPGAAYGGAKRWLPERFGEAAVKVAKAQRARLRAANQETNSPDLRAERLTPCPSCACSSEESNATVAIFGSKEESEVCARVQQTVEAYGQRCRNFAGHTVLAEFIELAAACDIYLTNDSGPMHIASALGVPTVVVFGATDEFATGPTGQQNRIVREPVDCSPCLLRECPIDHRCMTRVTSDRVAATALSLLAIESSPALVCDKRKGRGCAPPYKKGTRLPFGWRA